MSLTRRAATMIVLTGLCLTRTPRAAPQTPDIDLQIKQLLNQLRPPREQDRPAADAAKEPLMAVEAAGLPIDRRAKKKIDAAADFIESKEWGEAFRLLQGLLDAAEDSFISLRRADKAGQTTRHWTSARAEAARLIGALPPAGLEFYRLQYEGPARRLLDDAQQQRDPERLAEVGRRYFYTSAGAEAVNLLGTYHLDRGHSVPAAACFLRLLQRPDADKLAPLVFFKAAVAFRKAGDAAAEERAWTQLAERAGRDGLRLNGRTFAVEDLRRQLDRGPLLVGTPGDWPVFRGNPSRAASGHGATPYLAPRWEKPTATHPEVKRLLDQAEKQEEAYGRLVVPASSPVAAGGKLIYRGHDGVRALDPADGREVWAAPMPLSLEAVYRDPGKKVQVQDWLRRYAGFHHLLFDNSVLGCLSADARRVYAVEDLPIPPHPNLHIEKQSGYKRFFGPLTDAVQHNRLRALDLETGQLVWEVGGRTPAPAKNKPKTPAPAIDLNDAFFLGPPLPLAGRLYLLADKGQDLQLICLDAERGEPLWMQPVGSAHGPMAADAGRRVRACHLAYGDGVLVCPTNAGTVLGFDLLSRSLVWAHAYKPPPEVADEEVGWGFNSATLLAGWKAAAPVIHDGKVVVTPPDGDTLRCLDVRDGTLLWKVTRTEDDLYVGGAARGKVVLVGKSACRALDLKTGAVAWQRVTGPPSGQGVVGGAHFYLPLKKGAVAALDLDTGAVASEAACRAGGAPGNLVFSQGDLVSQTATAVTAYPQLAARLEGVAGVADPAGLAERGELRLDQGDLEGAAADLRRALALDPPPAVGARARSKLYDALTQLLRRDFAAGEKYLDEYRELCRAPSAAAERQRRHTQLLCLLARGREKQGRLLDAVKAYEELVAAGPGELLIVPEDPAVKARPDVWVRSGLADLIARATPAQRRELDDHLGRAWRELPPAADVADLARFADLYGGLGSAGREARQRLAARLGDEADRSRQHEAEMRLLRLLHEAADDETKARVTDALARLMARRGLLDDAVEYSRVLRRDFASVVVRDGKTGAALWDELAHDKRFLAPLDEPRPAWAGLRMKGTVAVGNFPVRYQPVVLDTGDAKSPFFRANRLEVETPGGALRVLDALRGTERGSLRLSLTGLGNYLTQASQMNVRVPCRTHGHLAVFAVGPVIVGVDAADRRVLWSKDLLGRPLSPNQWMPPSPDGGIVLYQPDGNAVRLGHVGPVTAACVCLQVRDQFVGLDPATGQTLWSRGDVAARVEVFGDDELVYLVEAHEHGRYGAGRAVRARDGVAVSVPDFAALYAKKVRVFGRRLLLSETDDREAVTLRLYDVRDGKDVWRRAFPAKTVVLESEVPELAGALTPGGDVVVFDVASNADVLKAVVGAKEADKVIHVYLLRDAERLYLALNGPPEDNAKLAGEPWQNVMGGLRRLPVNGTVYAFDRATGELRWSSRVPHQHLLPEQFEALPVLLFTCGQNRQVNVAGGQVTSHLLFRSLDKQTGKILLNKETINNGSLGPFHSLRADPRTGVVELLSYGVSVRHTPDGGK